MFVGSHCISTQGREREGGGRERSQTDKLRLNEAIPKDGKGERDRRRKSGNNNDISRVEKRDNFDVNKSIFSACTLYV